MPPNRPPSERHTNFNRSAKHHRYTPPRAAQVDGPPISTRAHKPKWNGALPSPPTGSADTVSPPGRPPNPSDPQRREQSPLPLPLPPVPPPPRNPEILPPPPNNVLNGDVDGFHQEALSSVVIGGDSILQLRELRDLREKDLSKRVNLKNAVRDIIFQWKHAERSQDKFMEACNSLMGAIPSQEMDTVPVQNLQKAWKQLRQLSEHVDSRDLTLGAALDDWFRLENKLSLKEGAVYQKLNGMLGGGRPEIEDDVPNIKTDHATFMSVRSSSSNSSMEYDAQRYYNCIGEMNLLRERIFNFESEHHRQEFLRDNQRRAGQRPNPPERVFFQKFLDEKNAMVQKYFNLMEQMEEIRASCERQGVTVEDPNLPPFLDHSIRVERSVQNQSTYNQREKLKSGITLPDEDTDTFFRTASWTLDTREMEPPELETWDTLSETTEAHTLHWKDQHEEGELAFPEYDRPVSSIAETDEPPSNEDRENMQTRYPRTFHGEAPSRRYSDPTFPTFVLPAANLQDGALERAQTHRLNFPSKSCILEKHPAIEYKPRKRVVSGTEGLSARTEMI